MPSCGLRTRRKNFTRVGLAPLRHWRDDPRTAAIDARPGRRCSTRRCAGRAPSTTSPIAGPFVRRTRERKGVPEVLPDSRVEFGSESVAFAVAQRSEETRRSPSSVRRRASRAPAPAAPPAWRAPRGTGGARSARCARTCPAICASPCRRCERLKKLPHKPRSAIGTTGTGVSCTIRSTARAEAAISPSAVSVPSGKMPTISPARSACAASRMPRP